MTKFRRLSNKTFKLIELVQQNTPIYDICSENYKDRVLLGNIFDKIARQLEIKGMACKLKVYFIIQYISNLWTFIYVKTSIKCIFHVLRPLSVERRPTK